MANTTPPKLSATDKAIRQLRNPAKFRGFAAAQFSGNYNADTCFKMFQNGKLDLFAEAAKVDAPGKHARNNWLGKDGKPLFTIYPEAIGLYLGYFGLDTEAIKTIIAENSLLTIEQETQVIMRQPTLTVPPGTSVDRAIGTAVAGAKAMSETFGPPAPTGLFQLPENVVFEKNKVLSATLEIDDDAITYLQALAGAVPNHGAVIGVVVYGVAEFELGTNR